MNSHTKTQVLIVGAGPTGLTLAAQLHRYGIDFIIVDKNPGPTVESRALVIHARTLEILDQIGLADVAISQGQILHRLALFSAGHLAANPDFSRLGEHLSQFPFILVLEQSKTEEILRSYLTRQGISVLGSHSLTNLDQSDNGVIATLVDSDGNERTIEASFVVGCDGARSATRHLIGLDFEGQTLAHTFFVADVQAELGSEPPFKDADPTTMFVALGDSSFVLALPMVGPRHWRLVGSVPDDEQSDFDEDIESEQSQSALHQVELTLGHPITIEEQFWFSTYRIHTRHVDSFRSGRCFLAGDAAHVHTPAGGQGMNTGIQDSYNLAWKLAYFLKRGGNESLLDSYNDERLANARRLVDSTDRMFNALTSDQWFMKAFRHHLFPSFVKIMTTFPPVREIIFPFLSQTGITYRDQSLAHLAPDEHFAVKAGDRFPYFEYDGKSIYHILKSAEFHLLLFAQDAENFSDQELQLEEFHCDLQVLKLTPEAESHFGYTETFTVLVRPDQHIASSWRGTTTAPATAYFSALSRA